MPNPPTFDFLQVWQHAADELIAARNKSRSIHRTSDIDAAGDEVEIPVRSILREKLPSAYTVGHGHIIDYMSHVSRQYDVIIAETGASPVFFRTENGTEYFAYESIYAIGEVRSTYSKAKKPIETWSANIAAMKNALQRQKTDVRQSPLAPDQSIYSNPLLSFMVFINSGDFEPENLSDFYKNTPPGDLPNVVCLLDRCVILSIQSGRNAEGVLVPLMMNPHPEFNIGGTHRMQHWSVINLGPDAFRAGCNLATLFYMLHTHLSHCKLSSPSMTAYLMRMLRDFRGARF